MHSGSEFLVPGTSQQVVGTGNRGGGAREVKWAQVTEEGCPSGAAAPRATQPGLRHCSQGSAFSLFFLQLLNLVSFHI